MSRPAAEQVLPGVYQLNLPIPRRARYVNLFLFLGPPVTLLDAGLMTPTSMMDLTVCLRGAGSALADIARVILSHPHRDHIGNARRIKSATGAKMLMQSQGVEATRSFGWQFAERYDELEREARSWGLDDAAHVGIRASIAGSLDGAEPVEPDGVLEGDEVLDLGGHRAEVCSRKEISRER